jgi:predicted choloylglycine hydrolase
MRHIDVNFTLYTKDIAMPTTTFRAHPVTRIDPAWRSVFADYWPAYSSWYRHAKGDAVNSAELKQAQRRLASVMPEIRPLYESLLEVADDCPVAALFLTGYQPPAYLLNCSQAVLLDDEPLLIRNYDLSPALSENLVTRSTWLGQDIIGTNECLWGLDDGMNRSGLAASLAFGGSSRVGQGFGIPFIMRYLLQTCENVREGIRLLQRVPSHMAYNVTLVDRHGDFATVMLAPGQAAIVTRERCATNHQAQVTWPEQAAFSKTRERKRLLETLLAGERLDERRLCDAFLEPPLLNTDFRRNFGTVYTAVYRPSSETMSYLWPAEPAWRHDFAGFRAALRTVVIGEQAIATTASARFGAAAQQPATERGLSADTRRQLLQALVYVPTTAVAEPRALAELKRSLLGTQPLDWNDFARRMAEIWRYGAPAPGAAADMN